MAQQDLRIKELQDKVIAPGQTIRNMEYAKVNGQSLQLDLYLPASKDSFPVIVFIHGGGFTAGDKSSAAAYAPFFTARGFAIASINYRLAPAAIFPDQIYDVKGAIRFLRAHATQFHLDPDRLAVFGTSAGGALASLAGVSCDVANLEGTVGGNSKYSSCVQATVNCFGSFSYENMMNTGFAPSREIHLEELFGCKDIYSEACREKIKMMAPESYIDKADGHFLILHGEKDTSVPLQNSIDFDKKLKAGGVSSILITDPHFGHGEGIIKAHFSEIIAFLTKALQ
ncbi:MAG: alpha/beta hydrolase [Chitinophagales bacterium]|nr:alpha/beta hydrolase [Chitinophagales bacterium]